MRSRAVVRRRNATPQLHCSVSGWAGGLKLIAKDQSAFVAFLKTLTNELRRPKVGLPAASPSAQRLLDGAEELGQLIRLGEVADGAGLDQLLDAVAHGVGAHHDDWDRFHYFIRF